MMDWYLAKTYSGYEMQVKNSLQSRITQTELAPWFGQLLVPTVNISELSDLPKMHLRYPGYVFLQMVINNETVPFVKEDRYVLGFVGHNDNPTPVARSEMAMVLHENKSLPHPRAL